MESLTFILKTGKIMREIDARKNFFAWYFGELFFKIAKHLEKI
jgi:hypothetical protein